MQGFPTLPRPEPATPLEQELAAERLSSLARATRALEAALERLAGAGHGERGERGERAGGNEAALERLARAGRGERGELAPAGHGERAGHGGSGAAALQRLLDEAGHRLWMVVVQREAMGLTRHEALYDALRVPPEVRRRMAYRPGL